MQARNQLLLYAFFRRELFSRYVGSVSGTAWALLNPLAQLAILSFVFGQIFRVASGPATPGWSYTAFVAIALWPWLAFADAVTRGLGAITGNAELVRKVAFPHVLLVIASAAASYAVNLAGFLAVLVALSLMDPELHLSGLPVVAILLVPHFVISVSIAAALAALQTFVRDVAHGVGVLLSILFYATPIVYPASMVPESLRGLLWLNPHTYFCERFRAILTGHPGLEAGDAAIVLASVVFALACAWFFQRLSPYFEELV